MANIDSEEHGQSRGIPFYINDATPRVHDGSGPTVLGAWSYANTATRLLLMCLESARGVRTQVVYLASSPGNIHNKRAVAPLAVPLFSLYEHVAKFLNCVQKDPVIRRRLPDETLRFLAEVERIIGWAGISKDSDVAFVRSKIGAHVDGIAVDNSDKVWAKVDLERFVDWGSTLLSELSLALALLDIFCWSRLDTPDDRWDVMSVDRTTLHLRLVEGKWQWYGDLTIEKSPKQAVADELRETLRGLLSLVGRAGELVNVELEPNSKLSPRVPPENLPS